MQIDSLLKNVAVKRIVGNKGQEITDIQFDSRKTANGHLFVATKGTAIDGHNFIEKAVANGVCAVVCEHIPAQCEQLYHNVCFIVVQNSAEALGVVSSNFYDNPSEKVNLIGVTGTNGKTTVSTLLYELFRKLGYKTGLLSTVVNRIDNTAVDSTLTTPDAKEINLLLSKMVDKGCEYVFMEVSSHAIDQQRIAGLKFCGGIFTNLTQDHLDYHKTMSEYLKAKKRFFDNLPKNAFALVNIDDKNGKVMLQNTAATAYTYSLQTVADFKTKIVEHDFNGMLLEINGTEISMQLTGRFNAYNVSAVFGAASILNQSKEEILRALSMLYSVSGRFETIISPQGYIVIVDYAHTPDALQNVISTINDILAKTDGRLISVVGCGGNRDKTKRPIMAKIATVNSAKTILTSDNPRDEDPNDIINDMLLGVDFEHKKNVISIVDRKEAIRTACMLAQKGDVVLIAGKGHENYQIVKGTKHYFDDKNVVLEIVGG